MMTGLHHTRRKAGRDFDAVRPRSYSTIDWFAYFYRPYNSTYMNPSTVSDLARQSRIVPERVLINSEFSPCPRERTSNEKSVI